MKFEFTPWEIGFLYGLIEAVQQLSFRHYPLTPKHHLDDMGPAFPAIAYNDCPFFTPEVLN